MKTDQSQRRRAQRKSRSPQHCLTTRLRTRFVAADNTHVLALCCFSFTHVVVKLHWIERTVVCQGRQADHPAARRGGWLVGGRAEWQKGVCFAAHTGLFLAGGCSHICGLGGATDGCRLSMYRSTAEDKPQTDTEHRTHLSRAPGLSTPTSTLTTHHSESQLTGRTCRRGAPCREAVSPAPL